MARSSFFPSTRFPSTGWVTSADYALFHVVVPEDAPPEIGQAAEDFISYWQRVTGHGIERSSEPVAEGVNVWIGGDGVPATLLSQATHSGLGEDGFAIRTIEGDPSHLLIIGDVPRGVQNGVYYFIEEYLGVRWLTPEVTHIPSRPPSSIPAIDRVDTPVFRYRYTNYTEPWQDSHFERVHRLRPPPMGLSGHTIYELVPPEVYGQEHPEYFATVEWGRVIPEGFDWRDPAQREVNQYEVGQINFAHPDVPSIIFDNLQQRIAENPEGRIWAVSQMDWERYDIGAQSATIDDRESTPMGSILTCVNRVADLLADEFPGHYVETMAHDWSRKPPRYLEPRDNVIIRLTTDGTDSSRPLSDSGSDRNRKFKADLEGWSDIADTLFVTYFAANQRNFQTPHPNLHVLQEDLRLFAEHGVEGVYAQGAPSPGGEFAHLRTYLLVKGMWNPDADLEHHKNEFLDLYYGDAAPAIREYIEFMGEQVSKDGVVLEYRGDVQWISFDTVLKAESIFKEALDEADNEEIRRRVELAKVPVQYATLVCPPRITISRTQFTLVRPPSLTLEQYIQVLQGFGVTQVEDGWPFERLVQQVGGTTPPRLRQYALERLESNQYHVWVVPEASGSIIRFRHLPTNSELMMGYQTFESAPGTLQEWVHDPGTVEGPIAERYEVSRRTFDSITVQTVLPDGLRVERQMTLGRYSDEFEVRLTLTNPTEGPIIPRVKLHPEFHATPEDPPEIWVEEGPRWRQIDTKNNGETPFRQGDLLDPDGCDRWAVRFPDKRITLVNTFDDDEIESLFYYYDVHPGQEHVNLELIAPTTPLEPGQRRTITTTYEVTSRTPQRL